MSPLIFKGDRANFPVPFYCIWIFCKVERTTLMDQFVIPRRVSITIRVTFPMVVNPRSTISDCAKGRFFRRAFRIYDPPAILLSAYIPYSIGPRVLSDEMTNYRFFRLVINGYRRSLRDSTVFLNLSATSPIQVAPIRRKRVRVCISASYVVDLCRFSRSVFLMENVDCHVLYVFTKPRTGTFVIFNNCLCVFCSRFFNRFDPFLNVGLLKVPLFRGFRPIHDQGFNPHFRPFNDTIMYFVIPFATKGNVWPPIGRYARAIFTGLLRDEILSFARAINTVFRFGFRFYE